MNSDTLIIVCYSILQMFHVITWINLDIFDSCCIWHFVQASKSLSFRNLQSWLKSCLSQNPFGVAACIKQGRQLCWPMAGEYL